ncbi:Eukaryotic translation initiation factor 4 gamma 1, partial [Stegodyphus mimosarum]
MARDALHHSGNPWQPFYKFKYKSGQYDYQEVPRKFRSILNKVTSKNFVTLVEQANSLHVNTEDKLNGVVDLIHEKAIHEPNFSSIYAKLSSRLAQLSVPSSEQPGKEVNFRKLLLAKCQLEFESKFNKMKERSKASDSAGDENNVEKVKKSRYRQLGNVIFIGELFKVNIVAESIIHHCIKRLLIERSEESLECFCGLLRTVGKYLEIAISRRSIQNNNVMDFYIYEVQKVIDSGFSSSRMRFMLEDLIELRTNDWFPLRICNFFGPISHICIEECNFQDNNCERIRKNVGLLLSNEMKEKIAHLVEQVSNFDFEEATKYVTELANAYSAFMFINLAVFQVIERNSQARHLLGRFLCLMVKNKILCLEEYCLGFSSVLKSVDEYSLDIPFLKEYIGEILAPMTEDSKLPLTFLKEILVPCIPSQTSGEITAAVLLLASKQKGKIRIAELWKASGLQWADFLHSNSEKEFIENH